MKRCPQCEFIYEDEQDLCDMDGGKLERVPAAPPGLTGASAAPTRPPAARRRRRFLAPLIGGAILTAILTSGYYVQTSQTAAAGHANDAPMAPTPAAPAAAGSQAETALPPESPAAAPESPESPPPAPAPPTKTNVKPPAEATKKRPGGATGIGGPAVKSPTPPSTRREEEAHRPESSDSRKEPKKGSKLGSALKKAGRVLKKPFGF